MVRLLPPAEVPARPRGHGYTEINIETTPGTAELVEIINAGNQTVPTVLYPDGSSATNPSLADVKKALG